MLSFKVRGNIESAVHDKLNNILGKVQDGITTSSNTIYSFIDEDNQIEKSYIIPPTTGCITITMVGGGGAGGTGSIKNGMLYSGGGGGAGGSYIKKPIMLFNPKKEEIKVFTKLGEGGKRECPHGKETVVTVLVGEKQIFKHISHGGKGGGSSDNNRGGCGGCCSTNEMFGGYEGQQGSVTISGVGKIFGGRGGNSAFEEGGLGGYQTNTFTNEDNSTNPCGLNGEMGSGGGGSVPGENNVGRGGNGFVIIEF